jgi:hypothetical protein
MEAEKRKIPEPDFEEYDDSALLMRKWVLVLLLIIAILLVFIVFFALFGPTIGNAINAYFVQNYYGN